MDLIELPENYRDMSNEELVRRIRERKEHYGERLLLLVHHYQRKEIVPFHDFLGDSYALSAQAAAKKNAKYIVFCGVHFMAESADILRGEGQSVYLPNPYAGCPMADMASEREVRRAWQQLASVVPETDILPLSYMNSTAALKAFTGRHGGLICTSSNARKALDWAYARAPKAFFFPDQYLGRNTARAMGVKPDDMILWKPAHPLGGNTEEAIRKAKLILWNGYCHVHLNFTAEQVAERRAEDPTIKVVVHPECRDEVVMAADAAGSTNFIVDFVAKQAAGSRIAIGTELNLVARLIDEHPDKRVVPLSKDACPMCMNMFRTTLNDLAYTLDHLEAPEGPGNLVEVPEAIKADARLALQWMLELG